MAHSKLVQLFTRKFTVQSRKDKIIMNGEDNDYPERIERLVNNSVTARLSAQKMITYLVGRGFGEEVDSLIVNKAKRLTFYRAFRKTCRDVAYQKGFYVHVNYNIEGKVNYTDVLPFKNCRISEADDFENPGYVWYRKNWQSGLLNLDRKKNSKSWFYPYNPDPVVIMEQRKKDAPKNATGEQLVKNYRGQVLFVSLEPETLYPNAWIDPAYNDADTEYHVSIFRNNRIKTGFVGATILLIPPGDSEEEELVTDDDLKSLMGSEEACNILKIELQPEANMRIKDYIHLESVKSDVNTEQFRYDEETVQANIMNCYNIPKVLVRNNDNSLFGASGELLRVAQEIYQEETREPREVVLQAFKMIYKGRPEIEGAEWIPLVEEENEPENPPTDGDAADNEE